jgi:hypothetical protein
VRLDFFFGHTPADLTTRILGTGPDWTCVVMNGMNCVPFFARLRVAWQVIVGREHIEVLFYWRRRRGGK